MLVALVAEWQECVHRRLWHRQLAEQECMQDVAETRRDSQSAHAAGPPLQKNIRQHPSPT